MGQRLLFFIFIIYLILAVLVFVAAQVFLFIVVCGLLVTSGRGAQALGVQALGVVARRFRSCGSWALEHRVSSCGVQAEMPRGMWDLPDPGEEPMSPALAGEFFTTEPPGKPKGGGF